MASILVSRKRHLNVERMKRYPIACGPRQRLFPIRDAEDTCEARIQRWQQRVLSIHPSVEFWIQQEVTARQPSVLVRWAPTRRARP